MKFTCNRDAFYDALQNVTKAISQRPPFQLLEGVQIITKEDVIELTCTDGQVFIRSTVPADIETKGSVVVSGRLFTDMVRRLPDGDVDISMSDKNLITIRGGGSRTSIMGQSNTEFPAMKTMFSADNIHLPQRKLKEMISQVIFAIAVGDVRQTLNGCFLELTKDELRLVGLDGFRLSLQQYNDNFILPNDTEKVSCIIPGKILGEVGHMLKDEDDMVTLHIDSTHIMFVIDNTIVVTSLYGGSYINYRAILPKEWESRVTVRREDIQGAVERAGLIARVSKNNIIKLKTEEGKLLITSTSEIGDFYEEMDAEIDGKPTEIAFNSMFVSDVIKNISEEFTCLYMNGPANPCIIKPKDKEDYTYLVMSVRM
ncbi:MAG: DNA polymerase III subunit beta [Christensenellaceae bacterium]|nr:DNA polymerase III subunit beta [Christensenellaceae bacterium]